MRRIFIVCLLLWPMLGFSKYHQLSNKSVRANPLADTLVLLQADGSKVHIVCTGNFVLSYCETIDGYTVVVDAIGMYEYAKRGRKGDMVAVGMQAKDENQRTPEEMRYLKKVPKHLRYTGETLKLFEDKQKRMDEAPAIIKRDKKNQ